MKIYLLFLAIIFTSEVLCAQSTPKNYDALCYCRARETPESVLSYDNNFLIVNSLKNGLSLNGLDSLNIQYTRSQIKLLQIFNLIRNEDGIYYNNIPILDESQTKNLRILSKQIADKIFPVIEPSINDFTRYMESIHLTGNSFSILFSYILDGLTWRQFESMRLIKPRDTIDIISPWTGHFWVLASRRHSIYGTNTDRNGKIKIYVTLKTSVGLLGSFFDNEELLMKMLEEIGRNDRITDPDVLKVYGKYNLFNDKGNLTVPLIIENDKNKLYGLSLSMALRICNSVIKNISVEEIINEYKFKDKEEALIILYHEILFDLMNNIEQNNMVEKPMIFKNQDNAKEADVAEVIFITEEQ